MRRASNFDLHLAFYEGRQSAGERRNEARVLNFCCQLFERASRFSLSVSCSAVQAPSSDDRLGPSLLADETLKLLHLVLPNTSLVFRIAQSTVYFCA